MKFIYTLAKSENEVVKSSQLLFEIYEEYVEIYAYELA